MIKDRLITQNCTLTIQVWGSHCYGNRHIVSLLFLCLLILVPACFFLIHHYKSMIYNRWVHSSPPQITLNLETSSHRSLAFNRINLSKYWTSYNFEKVSFSLKRKLKMRSIPNIQPINMVHHPFKLAQSYIPLFRWMILTLKKDQLLMFIIEAKEDFNYMLLFWIK